METAHQPSRLNIANVLTVARIAGVPLFGWLALDRREPLHGVLSAVLLVLGLNLARGLRDARTPLFVADDHGVRLRGREGWVGLLWSEMAEIRVERRSGVRHDARVKVVSKDGSRFYTSPLGLATNMSPGEAEVQLARRRPTAAY